MELGPDGDDEVSGAALSIESAWTGLVGVGGWVPVLDLGVTMTKVMVTGASGGIGAAIARQFAVRGSELVIVARRESALEALCDELLKLGAPTATYRTADLSDLDQVYELADDLDELGLDVLVNNAAVGHWDSTWDTPREKLCSMISLNVTALAVLTTAFSRLNRDRPARLINVASGAGYALFEGSIAYSASKYFVTALTEGLAQELATQGRPMRAQLFAPGPTATDFGVGSIEGSTMAAVRERDRSPSSIKVHSAQQAAQHAMELFDSDAVVGAVQPDMSFSLLGGRHSIGNLIDPDW